MIQFFVVGPVYGGHSFSEVIHVGDNSASSKRLRGVIVSIAISKCNFSNAEEYLMQFYCIWSTFIGTMIFWKTDTNIAKSEKKRGKHYGQRKPANSQNVTRLWKIIKNANLKVTQQNLSRFKRKSPFLLLVSLALMFDQRNCVKMWTTKIFLYSVISEWLNMLTSDRRGPCLSVSVSVCVCLSVCLWKL